ncbi:hypothetical protein BH20CHL4_BH20CHL4_09230 [soil metagenome]
MQEHVISIAVSSRSGSRFLEVAQQYNNLYRTFLMKASIDAQAMGIDQPEHED